MMHRRLAVFLSILALAILALATSTGASQDASPTPYPSIGIAIEDLVSTPPFPALPPNTSVSLDRITYQPGASFELNYAGPVVYYIERGKLAVQYRFDGTEAILQGPSAPIKEVGGTGQSEVVLPTGFAILAENGKLGPTRNVGDELLVVLAVLLVPQGPRDGTETVTEDATPRGG